MKKFLQESKLLWIFLLIVFLVSLVSADEKTDKVDKLFSKWDSTISPGAALAIIKDGKIIYKRGYGMANLEHNIPITPTSVFRIGSTSKQELEDKTGNYRDERTGTWTIISMEEGKLVMEAWGEKYVLTPVSKTRFQALDAPFDNSIEFFPDEKGIIRKAKLTIEGDEEINLVKASKLRPLTPSQLKEYAGEYYNDELPVTYKLAVEKGSLFFKHKNAPKGALKAMDRDKFTMRWFNIEFVRDKRKRIKGFVLGAGRAANIEFVKK